MKKYSSYFNKRYFPEPDEEADDELDTSPLSDDELLPESPLAEPAFEQDLMVERSAPVGQVSVEPEEEDDEVIETPVITSATIPAPPVYHAPNLSKQAPSGDAEATIISKSAIINGELTVSGDVHMFGKIKGNLTAQGNLEIAGKVIGNVAGNDIELNHCELKGDVNASGFVFMDKESIMIGNVNSQDITLDGKVKGDVVAAHKVYVRANAVIVGNVHAATIAIDEGAALQGQVIIANQDGDSLKINEDGPSK